MPRRPTTSSEPLSAFTNQREFRRVELFSIVCTTCQAKLQVRDKSAIGKILACPKCGSMVMVEAPAHLHGAAPPSGTSPPQMADSHNSPTHNSPTHNSPTHNSPSPTLPSAETKAKPGQPPPQRKPRFRGEFPEPAKSQQLGAAKPGLLDRNPAGMGQTDSEGPDQDLLGESWVSPAARQLKQIVVLLAAAVFGIALAVGLIALIASWRSAPDQPVATGAAAEERGDPIPQPKQSGGTEDPDPGLPVDAADFDSPPASDVADVPESSPGDEATMAADENPPADGPDALNPALHGQPPTIAPAADSDNPPGLEPPKSPPVDMPDVGSDPDVASDDRESTPELPASTGERPPATVDSEFVKSQLSTVVNAVEFDDVALADFARFVSDFTAVPVTMDLDSLATNGITAGTSLSFQYRGVTIEQLLNAVLEPAGMAFVVDKRQITVTTRDASTGNLVEQTYNVADLIETPEGVQALAEQLTRFVQPASWAVHGGQGTIAAEEYALVVEQWPAVQFQVAMLLDRIRLCGGLLPRSDLPIEWISVEPAYERATALSEPVTINFSTDTPIRRILEYLNAESDLRILVDWQAAASADWAPHRPSQMVGTNQPLDELLTSWLAPSKLAFRVVDEYTIQITSRAKLAARPDVEFFRRDSPPDLEAVEQQLRQQLERETPVVVAYDAPSRCLIVALPQPQQHRVAQILGGRSSGP